MSSGEARSYGAPRKCEQRVISGIELAKRAQVLGRLFSAWPGCRPANTDATMCEYLEATRGVNFETGELSRLVSLVIADGGEFAPPAGAILQRGAKLLASRMKRTYSASTSITDRIEIDVEKILRQIEAKTAAVESIDLDDVRYALSGNATGGVVPRIEGSWR